MRPTRALFLCATLLALLALTASPASAQGCSVCTEDGECVPVDTSGNCYCNIRHTNTGYRICRPQGICDLLDPNSCDPGGGPSSTSAKVAVDAAGLSQLEEQDPLVGTAIRAAAEPEFAPDGRITGTYFVFGIHEGSLRHLDEETGYRFRIVVSQGESGSVKLRGQLTSAAGKVVEFRGDLRAGGRSGQVAIERDSRGQMPRTLVWTAERSPRGE